VGTTTDAQGRFTVKLPAGKNQLEVSYAGYQKQTIGADKGAVNLRLTKDLSELSEVQVVGYGIQKKSDLTGAISSIKGADVSKIATQRVDQAIQGRAAGVFVLNTDGQPGGNTTIRVRGMNSINGGNNALIVVDGLQGGNLNSLNPNDIESIEILKDASATAIYGAQGANGVVLVTTRLGKKGKPVIGYNYTFGLSELRKKLDVMNAADFAKTINAAVMTQNGSGSTPVPIFTDEQIAAYEQKGGTDWQDEIYRTAPMHNHELAISGGTDNLKYLVSGGYLDQDGILVNSGYKRFSLRTNILADINNWASFGFKLGGYKREWQLTTLWQCRYQFPRKLGQCGATLAGN
jgi:TonB-linked SusC/RagA family outer membrane protein